MGTGGDLEWMLGGGIFLLVAAALAFLIVVWRVHCAPNRPHPNSSATSTESGQSTSPSA